jgi:predicted translin family RNA/ssDNA-binding protein
VIRRQLDLFEREHGDLLRRSAEAKRAYDAADRDEAEERFGDYMDLVDEATEELADLRDHYAAALEEPAAEEYAGAFNRAVLKRFRQLALGIEE